MSLSSFDPELAQLISDEEVRQRDTLALIPSENFASKHILDVSGSLLTNKYAEGYPGKRYYGGNPHIDAIERLAKQRAKELFGCEYVNVQPLSGSPANLAIYTALLEPGDTVMGLDLAHGGHLTHGHKVNISGQLYTFEGYGVRPDTHLFDYDEIRAKALACKPKMIVCGATAYPRFIDFEAFASIAKEVGAILMADISHIAGLVVGGVHPSPIPHADVVMTTTHKTLRGPRAAIIMMKKPYARKINKAVFPGIQGGPHMNTIAAVAVCLQEASTDAFKQYAHDTVHNANVLAQELREFGYELVTGGTDNHLLLADLTTKHLSGMEAQTALEEAGMIVNKNMVPYDGRSPMDPSGIRLGSPALTTRGFKEEDMRKVAMWMHRVLSDSDNTALKSEVRQEVETHLKRFPLPGLES